MFAEQVMQLVAAGRGLGEQVLVWLAGGPARLCGLSCGPSRVVDPLAAADGGTSRRAGPAELISCRHRAGNRTRPGHGSEEATMPPAILYRLAQTQIADLYRQAQRDAPGLAASWAHRARTPAPGHRDRGLRAVVARRVLAVLGGGSP
jgi:hypothetical protein